MRRILLALVALGCAMPVAAEAARRDERGGQSSRVAQQAPKANTAAKPERQSPRQVAAPSRQANASRATTQRSASPRTAARSTQQRAGARAPDRGTASRAVAQRPASRTVTQRVAGRTTSRQAASQAASRRDARQQVAILRPGDIRLQRTGFVMRGAAAAAIPREAAAQACTRRNGRTNCAPPRDSIAGWQVGLPRADNSQQSCPNGTFATLARGHDDVVRCMPI